MPTNTRILSFAFLLGAACAGLPARSAEIATLLHLSVKTVDTHRANMREKLDLPNGAALAFYATHWIATTV